MEFLLVEVVKKPPLFDLVCKILGYFLEEKAVTPTALKICSTIQHYQCWIVLTIIITMVMVLTTIVFFIRRKKTMV